MSFATAILSTRGRVDNATLATARLAGLTDGALVEVAAHVALNVFTNYLNDVAQTEVDFPRVELAAA